MMRKMALAVPLMLVNVAFGETMTHRTHEIASDYSGRHYVSDSKVKVGSSRIREVLMRAYRVSVPSGQKAEVTFARKVNDTLTQAFNCDPNAYVVMGNDVDNKHSLEYSHRGDGDAGGTWSTVISSTTVFAVLPSCTLEYNPEIVGQHKVLGNTYPLYAPVRASTWVMTIEYCVTVKYSGGSSTPAPAATVRITFNGNGGSGAETVQTVGKGVSQTLSRNASSTKYVWNGYAFAGWATSVSRANSGIVDYADGARITANADVTLYAVWRKITVNKVTVVFNANGGTGSMADQTFVSGTAQKLISNRFVRSGHSFAGWATNSTGSVAHRDGATLLFGKDQSGTCRLYAKWTAKTVGIALSSDVGGQSWSQTLSRTVGQSVGNLPEPAACEGYAFVGWYDHLGNAVASGDKVPAQGLKLYAKWRESLRTVVVALKPNGGNAISPSSVSYALGGSRVVKFGSALPVPTHPKNYLFNGWFTEASGGTAVDAETVVDGSVTRLYAHWCEGLGMDATGAYVVDPGGYAIRDPVTFPMRMKGTLSEDSEAWIEGKGDCASLLFTAAVSQSCNVYLTTGNVTAEITDNTLDVTVTCAGQKTSHYFRKGHDYTITVVYPGRLVRAVGTVERVQFELEISAGRATIPYLDSPTGIRATTDSCYDTEVFWEPVEGAEYYRVYAARATFDGQWKTGSSPSVDKADLIGMTYGTNFFVSTAVAGEWTYYYVLAVNDRTTSSTQAAVPALGYQKAALTAFADYDNPVPAKGGSGEIGLWCNRPWTAVSDSDWLVLTETSGDAETSTFRFAFVCSQTDAADDRTARVTVSIGPSDEPVVTTLSIRQRGRGALRSLNFDSGAGSEVADKSVYERLPVGDLEEPQRTGYLFAGWTYKDLNSGRWCQVSNETTVAEILAATGGTTLEANWHAVSWRIAYDANGGTGKMADDWMLYGVSATLSTNLFVRTGYTFRGWSTGEDGDVEFADGDEVLNLSDSEGDVLRFYAVWEPNLYVVAFSADESGDDAICQDFTYDVADTLSPCAFDAPSEDAVFLGWSLTPGGRVAYGDGESVRNLTAHYGEIVWLYARWRDCRVVAGEACVIEPEATSLSGTVSWSAKGLPAGMKIAARDLTDKTLGEIPAGTIYGTASKPGTYGVRVSADSGGTTEAFDIEIVVGNYTDEALPLDDAYDFRVGTEVRLALGDDFAGAAASGLPSGLKFAARAARDATFGTVAAGTVYGVPSKVSTNCVIFTKKEGGTTHAASATFAVAAAPAWSVGTFNGRLDDGSGSVTLTVAANGKISGKVMAEGKTWTFSAPGYGADGDVSEDAAPGRVLAATAKSGKATAEMALKVTAGGVVGSIAGDGIDAALTLWRNAWKDRDATDRIKAWVGLYTVQLAGEDVGYGYLSLSLDAKGNCKAAGKLPDGTSASATLPLAWSAEADAPMAIWQTAPSAYKGGYVGGLLAWERDGSAASRAVAGDGIVWVSKAPAASAEYGAGFSRTLSANGAYYDRLASLAEYYGPLSFVADAPALDATVKTTSLGQNGRRITARESATIGAATLDCWSALTVSPDAKGATFAVDQGRATKPVQDKDTKAWSYAGANDAALTFGFTKATGIFKGTFTCWYDYVSATDDTREPVRQTLTHASKKVAYEGVMVLGESLRGFYLWNRTGTCEDEKSGKEKTFKYAESRPVVFDGSGFVRSDF